MDVIKVFGPVLNERYIYPFSRDFTIEEVCAMFGFRYGPYVFISNLTKVDNSHPEPIDHFIVTASNVKKAHRDNKGLHLIGYIHTHPPELPEPSQNDIDGMPNTLLGAVWTPHTLTWYTNNGNISAIRL